jgi:hypothetical protein
MSKNQSKLSQLFDAGRINECIALALRLLKKNPDDLFVINLLIRIYLNVNIQEHALFYFKKSLSIDPNQREVLFNYSVFLDSIGNYSLAIKIVNDYLELYPKDESALVNKGFYLRNIKSYDEAIKSFLSAILVNSQNYLCYVAIGYIYYLKNEINSALDFYNQSISINPNSSEAYLNRGLALSSQNLFEEAIADFNRAISINPNLAEAYLNRGLVFYKIKKYEDSMSDYNKSIHINPLFIDAYHNRGLLFETLGQHPEAIQNFKKILSLDPNNFEAYFNMADNFKYLRRYKEAIISYEKSIELKKDYHPAYWNLASVLLKLKDMGRGWNYYEHRIQTSSYKNNLIQNQPVWLIDSDTSNKILLIHPDGGFGDFIQFYRFVLVAIKLFKKVILRCPLPLIELFESNSSLRDLEFLSTDETIPNFDYQCLIMSLPYLTKCENSLNIEIIPYIKPNVYNLKKWANLSSIKKLPKIGICWQGTQRDELDIIPGQNRSIPLHIFKELFNLPLEFHILQPEISNDDNELLDNYKNIHSYKNKINNFSDTASIIHHLDLVISIDTSLAHLCGAMDKETWILLPYLSDYRWGDDLQHFSPWYNSIILFRQERNLSWLDLLKKINFNLLKKFT